MADENSAAWQRREVKSRNRWRLVLDCLFGCRWSLHSVIFPLAAVVAALLSAMGDRALGNEALTKGTPAQTESINPHSDLIFRATGATSCRDCHRTDRTGRLTERLNENAMIQALRDKAKGIHGPGRFADCLRCHAGGEKGVEKYR